MYRMPSSKAKGFHLKHTVHSSFADTAALQCDRLLPCSNCVFRNKQSACHYENESTITKQHSASVDHNASSEDGSRSPMQSVERAKGESDSAAQLSALGYAKSSGHNSFGIFKKIENHEGAGQTLRNALTICQPDYNGLKENYKSLVRQLPARNYVDQLISTYFNEVNWHYSALDQDFFMEQLQNWNNVSFSVLNRGPQDLPGDIRYFPALLFQVLALALQFQPPQYDSNLDSLKYVSEMSLDDLANDYSESGVAILSLLGKRDLNLVTVQAGFLRTSFLKNSGFITESWHSLGQTIRDAQELGWHKDPIDRRPQSPEKALETLWLAEVRRRMWIDLQLWDAHMALVLGRPTSIDHRDVDVILPMDTPPTKNHKGTAPLPRSESDPPTPLTMLINNSKFLLILQDILALQKEGVHPKDYTKVERLHQEILKRIEHIHPALRSDHPDTTFDDRSECKWLPTARQIMTSQASFIIMALHKPYVFTNSNSRHEALKAGLTILKAQRHYFQNLQARHYKLFNIVLSTFDALVLMSAIYILHPTEHMQYLSDSLQHLEWTMERFELISSRNQLAKTALGVLQAVQVRLYKALERHSVKIPLTAAQVASAPTPLPRHSLESPASNSSSNGLVSTPDVPGSIRSSMSTNSFQTSKTSSTGISDYSTISANSAVNPMVNPSGTVPGIPPPDSEWEAFPNNFTPDFNANFDLSGMAPLQPMHDLLYNDLVGISDDPNPAVAANAQTFYDSGAPWQFEGGFTDDSFWNFMNQYNI